MQANQNHFIEISIVVPVYNSEIILPELILQIFNTFKEKDFHYEIILVNDCSTDKSWNRIQEFSQKHSNIKGIKNERNIGQAYTSLKGIAQSKGDFIVTIDDDLEYHPSDILLLYHHIKENHFDLVFGIAKEKYRKQGKSQKLAEFRNKLLNKIWNKPITDSFKIFRRNMVFNNDVFLPETHFEGFVKKNIRKINIGYLEVNFSPRFAGKSNYTFLKKWRLFVQMSRGFFNI